MDQLTRCLLQPFIKVNPFEDYIIVDTITFANEERSIFKAYYKASNSLVEIVRFPVLLIEVTV